MYPPRFGHKYEFVVGIVTWAQVIYRLVWRYRRLFKKANIWIFYPRLFPNGHNFRSSTLNNRWKFQLYSDFLSWDIQDCSRTSKKWRLAPSARTEVGKTLKFGHILRSCSLNNRGKLQLDSPFCSRDIHYDEILQILSHWFLFYI